MNASGVLASTSFRLALLHVSLILLSSTLLLGYIYWATAGHMARQADATIRAEILGLAEQYAQRGLAGLTDIIDERIESDPGGVSVYLLTDEGYRPLVGNLSLWPRIRADADGWIEFRLRERDERGTKERRARARTFDLPDGQHLLVGRDLRALEATRGLILDALTWGLPVVAVPALLGGWLISAGVVRRIEAINQVCRQVMKGDLKRRVRRDGSEDEIDQLGDNLNRMLARIEDLMRGVRQVSDNIAHDLRTPLARLHGRLSHLTQVATLPKTQLDEIDAAIADADELLSTFNALLRIARIEAGASRAAFGEVDLVRLVEDVGELYEPLASEKGQELRIDTTQDLRLVGDRHLLFQALANLTDNAIKYAPERSQIHIQAERRQGRIELTVSDQGAGIPSDLRDRVLERFYRIEHSRTSTGHGLGLTLVQAVAELHGARLELSDANPGLRATLKLPDQVREPSSR